MMGQLLQQPEAQHLTQSDPLPAAEPHSKMGSAAVDQTVGFGTAALDAVLGAVAEAVSAGRP